MTETLRAPFSYFGNKRSIAPIVWSRLGNVDFYSEPFCLLPDQRIAVARNGINKWLFIKEIIPGDSVLTADGYHRVTSVMSREYTGHVYNIQVYGHPDILALTPEHPILALRLSKSNRGHPKRRQNVKSAWNTPNLLQAGDALITHFDRFEEDFDLIDLPNRRYGGVVRDRAFFLTTDEETLNFIGFYLAEGHLEERGGGFTFHKKEREYAERLSEFLAENFETPSTIKVRAGTNTLDVRFSNVQVARFLRQFGSHAHYKHCPTWLLHLPPEKQKYLLRALFQGDGHHQKNNGGWSFTSVSLELAENVLLLCRRQGLMPSLRRCNVRGVFPNNKRKIVESIAYQVTLEQRIDMPKMDEIMDVVSIESSIRGIQKSGWNNGVQIANRIKNINKISYSGLVYNLSVDVAEHYVTPTATVHNCGSGAVYFARPNPRGTEIVNDAEGLLVNVFRSITYSPEETARLIPCPPSEIDILARERWLMEVAKPKLELLKTDPFYHDPQAAAFYIFGLACFVGNGFCDSKSYKNRQLKVPKVSNEGIFRSDLNGDVDRITDYFKAIAWRMRHTKIACGDWSRVVTPIWTTGNQDEHVAGIFLDSPYDDSEHSVSYSAGGGVAHAVRLWAIENGNKLNMRICVAGYSSDNYTFPATWQHVSWRASGGYANQSAGRGRENAKREMLWFSPGCLKPDLFQFINQDQSEELVPEDELEIDEPITEIDLPELIQPKPEVPEPEVIILSKEIIKKEYRQADLFEFMSE